VENFAKEGCSPTPYPTLLVIYTNAIFRFEYEDEELLNADLVEEVDLALVLVTEVAMVMVM
jgi:hypothetical protein